jgi:hypothetical protein
MSKKPILPVHRKPVELTRHIIAEMKPGDELSDAGCPGLRVRCNGSARVFFYRYRLAGGTLRQIKLGEFGPLTLPAARVELTKRRLERERGSDPQEEKKKARELPEQNLFALCPLPLAGDGEQGKGYRRIDGVTGLPQLHPERAGTANAAKKRASCTRCIYRCTRCMYTSARGAD